LKMNSRRQDKFQLLLHGDNSFTITMLYAAAAAIPSYN
jgi:hypothetical protein